MVERVSILHWAYRRECKFHPTPSSFTCLSTNRTENFQLSFVHNYCIVCFCPPFHSSCFIAFCFLFAGSTENRFQLFANRHWPAIDIATFPHKDEGDMSLFINKGLVILWMAFLTPRSQLGCHRPHMREKGEQGQWQLESRPTCHYSN